MARWLLPTASVLLFLAGLLVRSAPATPYDAAISAVVIVLLALPCYLAVVRSQGPARALALIAGLSLLSMTVEAIGVLTGVPYGHFSYSTAIGTAVIGPVPWTVGFAYVPLLLGACALACRYASGRSFARRVAASALLLVAADLVLDPGAALLGYWIWAAPGLYYGIPASNFLGWLLTGAVYSAITLRFVVRELPPTVASSFLLIIAFWTGVAVGTGMVVPAAIGFGLLFITWKVLGADRAG